MNKEGSFKPVFIALALAMLIALSWESVSFVKDTAHSILDPTAGVLLGWNVLWGMILLVTILSLFMSLMQKYTTDQKEIKRLKDEQKDLQKQMKEVKDNPEKVIELQKTMFPLTGELMKHSMRPMIYTTVPLILFFRWFMDYFNQPALEGFKFFGFFSWFWFYLLGSIIIGSFIRKFLKVY
ncbi:MAG: EMC3/TMCO1 family protein [archaeon]